jgi:DNA-binding CsgD family transcriptional regulator
MEIWAANSAFPAAIHTAELRTVVRSIAEAGADCVVVTGAPGAGLSTFLDAAARSLSGRFAVRAVGVPQQHSSVRFAIGSILAPKTPVHAGATPLTVLRACHESLSLGMRPGPPVLLAVDDADRLDESSLWVLNQLRAEGRVRLLLGHHKGCQLKAELISPPFEQRLSPVVLEDLDLAGLMRLLQLPPTTNPPPPLVMDLYAMGGGNLLRTQWLIADAAERGAIGARDGLPSMPPADPAAVDLTELARRRWARRTDAERHAVDLLAVGEPVGLEHLEHLVAPATLSAMEREGTIRVQPGPRALVLLAHAADGLVARGMLERARSIELRGRLLESRRRTEESLWDLLNRVEHLQDAGVTVPDLDLLAAARASNCLNDSPRAIRAAAAVGASELHLPAQTELGRALFQAKDYEGSAEVLLRLTAATPTVVSVEFARAVGLLLDVLLQSGAETDVMRTVLDQARQRLRLAVAGSAGHGDAVMDYQNTVREELEVLGVFLESLAENFPRPEGGLYGRICKDEPSGQARGAARHPTSSPAAPEATPGNPARVLLAMMSNGLANEGNFAAAADHSLRMLQSAAEQGNCSVALFSTVLGIHPRNVWLGPASGVTGGPAADSLGGTAPVRGDGAWTGRNLGQFRSTSFAAANGYRALDLLDLCRPARPADPGYDGLRGALPGNNRSAAVLTQDPSTDPGPEPGGRSAAADTGRQRTPAPGRLSPRECEVAALAVAGLGSAAVAAHLGISVNTVNAHLHRVYAKLGISRRHDLTRLWKGLRPTDS